MKEMKLLVYGEGPDDYGWKDGMGEWNPGSAIYFLRKCADGLETKLEISYVEKSFIDGKNRMKPSQRRLKGLCGKGVPALRFTLYALNNGYHKGIFYCDTDKVMDGNQKDERNCRKYFEKLYLEIKQGLEPPDSRDWKGIPMISMKMIESWLLSDKEAYQKCFGREPDKVKLPSKPELIWGAKDNPSSDYPKNYIKRVLGQYKEEPNRANYADIAAETSIDVLKAKCPISFARFYEDFAEVCAL